MNFVDYNFLLDEIDLEKLKELAKVNSLYLSIDHYFVKNYARKRYSIKTNDGFQIAITISIGTSKNDEDKIILHSHIQFYQNDIRLSKLDKGIIESNYHKINELIPVIGQIETNLRKQLDNTGLKEKIYFESSIDGKLQSIKHNLMIATKQLQADIKFMLEPLNKVDPGESDKKEVEELTRYLLGLSLMERINSALDSGDKERFMELSELYKNRRKETI